jgi:hypothetical protein
MRPVWLVLTATSFCSYVGKNYAGKTFEFAIKGIRSCVILALMFRMEKKASSPRSPAKGQIDAAGNALKWNKYVAFGGARYTIAAGAH